MAAIEIISITVVLDFGISGCLLFGISDSNELKLRPIKNNYLIKRKEKKHGMPATALNERALPEARQPCLVAS